MLDGLSISPSAVSDLRAFVRLAAHRALQVKTDGEIKQHRRIAGMTRTWATEILAIPRNKEHAADLDKFIETHWKDTFDDAVMRRDLAQSGKRSRVTTAPRTKTLSPAAAAAAAANTLKSMCNLVTAVGGKRKAMSIAGTHDAKDAKDAKNTQASGQKDSEESEDEPAAKRVRCQPPQLTDLAGAPAPAAAPLGGRAGSQGAKPQAVPVVISRPIAFADQEFDPINIPPSRGASGAAASAAIAAVTAVAAIENTSQDTVIPVSDWDVDKVETWARANTVLSKFDDVFKG